MKLIAVVPAYNEVGSIEAVCRELESYGYDYVVVNDCSTDGTDKLCLEKGFNMISLPEHGGLTAGVHAGLKYALDNGYDAAVQFDGDGQHNALYIGAMLKAAENSDLVIGSRTLCGEKPEGLRAIAAGILGAMIKLKTGRKLTDPTCGMRLYGPALLRTCAEDPHFSPEPDTVARLIKRGYSVCEVPVSIRKRTSGSSYLSGLKPAVYMIRVSLSILFLK